VFHPDSAAQKGARTARWPLLFYALWWTIHIGGATAEEARDAVIGRV
jgi:hypothetical protein